MQCVLSSQFHHLTAVFQSLLRKLTHGLQEAISCATTGFVHLHQRLVYQAVQRVEDCWRPDVPKRADRLGRIESPSICEYSQPSKQLALIGRKQIVTPADGRG
jgi:hypothetical protein